MARPRFKLMYLSLSLAFLDRVLLTQDGAVHDAVAVARHELLTARGARETFHVVGSVSGLHHELARANRPPT